MIKHELILFGVEVSASSTRPNNKTSSREAPAKILTSKMCLDARGEEGKAPALPVMKWFSQWFSNFFVLIDILPT